MLVKVFEEKYYPAGIGDFFSKPVGLDLEKCDTNDVAIEQSSPPSFAVLL